MKSSMMKIENHMKEIVSFDELDVNILETLDKLEPFGQNNEPPLLACFNVNLDEFKLIGKEQNHLRMIFSSNDKKIQAVKWNEGELQIPFNSKCDIAFYPRLNVFNDIESVQLEIVDMYCQNLKVEKNIKHNDYKNDNISIFTLLLAIYFSTRSMTSAFKHRRSW